MNRWGTSRLPLVFLCLQAAAFAADQGPPRIHPEKIASCLRLPEANAVEIATTINPYYLRGDFDGDGVPDYAVAVRAKATRRLGVLICSGTGRGYLLGAVTSKNAPFSTMPGDNFFAPNWLVYSVREAEVVAGYADAPKPFPTLHSDSIAMLYEDGFALIYWDGNRFRWVQ